MADEDYKKGYRDGWLDAIKHNPWNNIPTAKEPINRSCLVCGMSFVDSMGRFNSIGYVCNDSNCPSRITSFTRA